MQRVSAPSVLLAGLRPRRAAAARVLPGFGLSLGVTLSYLALVVLIPLTALFARSSRCHGRDCRAGDVAARLRGVPAHVRHVSPRGADQRGLRAAGCLGARALPFPGRRFVDALVDLPFALPTAVAGIALTSLYSTTAGSGGCSRSWASRSRSRRSASWWRSSSSGCRSSCARCSRCWRTSTPSRGSGGEPRREPLADVPPGDPADDPAGARHRLCARVRARARRVRLGRLHLRQHAAQDGDRAAADHDASWSSSTTPGRRRSR